MHDFGMKLFEKIELNEYWDTITACDEAYCYQGCVHGLVMGYWERAIKDMKLVGEELTSAAAASIVNKTCHGLNRHDMISCLHAGMSAYSNRQYSTRADTLSVFGT